MAQKKKAALVQGNLDLCWRTGGLSAAGPAQGTDVPSTDGPGFSEAPAAQLPSWVPSASSGRPLFAQAASWRQVPSGAVHAPGLSIALS